MTNGSNQKPTSTLSKITAATLGVTVVVAGVLFWFIIQGLDSRVYELQMQLTNEKVHVRETYVPKDEYNRNTDEIKGLIKDLDDDIKEGFRLVTEKLEREVN